MKCDVKRSECSLRSLLLIFKRYDISTLFIFRSHQLGMLLVLVFTQFMLSVGDVHAKVPVEYI